MNLAALTLIVSSLTGFAMTLVLFTVYKSYPKSIKGIGEWSYAMLLVSVAMLLLLARGRIPDLFSIVLANTLILIAFIQTNIGTRLLCDHRSRIVKNQTILILLSFVGMYSWFTYISPSMSARILIIAAFLIPIVLEQLIFVWINFPKSTGKNIMLLSLSLVIFGRGFRAVGVFNGTDVGSDLFENSLANILSVAIPALTIPLCTVSCIMLASERLHRNLEHASRHDDLTDSLNKKAITEILQQEIKRTKRVKNKLSIMLLDLDNFKKINDQYGHLIGDKVLIDFAKKSKQSLRETDHLSRFGGDEFMAVLPDTSIAQALFSAERINKVGQSSVPRWSVSIGIAECSESDTFETILTRADDALYKAKFKGKNQTHVGDDLSADG